MDTLTLILATVALLGFVGLAFLGGWELGNANGVDSERALANRRVNGLLADLNNRRPKAARNRRKAARKAVRA
jgi:hypothetical protein